GHAASPTHLERVRGSLVAEATAARAAGGARTPERGRAAHGGATGGSMTTPRARVVSLGEGRPTVEALDACEGAPPILPHGAGGVPAWEGVLPLLAREYHVFAPLLPGFGRSTGLESLEDQLDLVLHQFDVIEALDLQRPYVVGESMGGWIAAEMATIRP